MILFNPKNLIKHELIGLKVRIESTNYSYNNFYATILDETKNTLLVETKKNKKK